MAFLYDDPCILVGGAPRSGTTLLGTILSSHSQAAVLLEERLTNVVLSIERLCSIRTQAEEAERTALFGGARSFLSLSLYENELDIEKLGSIASYTERFRRLFKDTFEVTTGKNDVVVVGSKLPISGVWEDIDFLRQRLRDLRIIFIVRNPLDVISSSLTRGHYASLGLDEWSIRSVEPAYQQWLFAMRRMSEIYDSSPQGQVLLVKYEDLCSSPERVERHVRAFASLPFDSQSLVSRAPTNKRSALSVQDLVFLDNELGDPDLCWPTLTAEQALRRYSATIRHLPFGEFSLANDSFGWVFTSGFSDAEPWGRWTDGPCATLRFRCLAATPRARLGLDVAMARVPSGKDGAPLVVRINGGPPIFALATPRKRLDIELSNDDLAKEVLTVEITVLEPKPRDEAPLHDPRELGIALTGLSLRAL